MGTRRLKAEIDFDVTGQSDLKGAGDQLVRVGNAGENMGKSMNRAALEMAAAEARSSALKGKINSLAQAVERGEKSFDDAEKELKEYKQGLTALPEPLDKAEKKTGLLSGTVGKLVAAGLFAEAGRQLIQFGQASITAASDVEEMQSKFDAVFKGLSGEVTNELQEFADAANRSVFDLQGFAATLQDTFVPLGFARDEAAATSVEIVKLAEDLASFNNLQTGDVVRDLQSALVGNTETLRKYGVVATQAAIDQEALALGLDFTKGSMDAQTKAAAILSLTMKSTTDAQGDAIRTADSFANVSKGLEAAVKDLQVALGNDLLPVATQIVSEFTSMARAALEAKAELGGFLDEVQSGDRGGFLEGLDDLNRDFARLGTTAPQVVTSLGRLIGQGEDLETIFAHTSGAAEEYAEELAEAERVTQELSSADAVLLSHTQDIAFAAAEAQAEIRGMHQEAAAAAGPNEELSDKIAQVNNMLSEEEAALARSRGELNLLTGEIEATAEPMETMVSLTDRINERLGQLGNRHDFLLSLDVEGLEGLQEAIDLAGGFMNENIDPFAPQGDRDFGDQFDPSAAFDDPNFASGTGGQFLQVPGPTGAPFPVVLHGGESFNVVPAGESPGGGGASNNVSISQIFNGPVDPGMVQSETEAALAEAGIRGF